MKNIIIGMLIIAVLAAVLSPQVSANEGHLKLLAVSESESGYKGSVADLYLRIEPGDGNIYIDTYPLTKLDTQISTRFAKEIACNFLDMDCSDKDFFYTIRSSSSIIGGPSAGSAITVVTVALLSSEDFDESIAITGTINSGGAIGPVGGLKAKIEAAADANLTKVIIPKGERMYSDETGANVPNTNGSDEDVEADAETAIDLKEYARSRGIELVEVSTLNEAMFYFTGRQYKETGRQITLDPIYEDTMKEIAQDLCQRTANLKHSVIQIDWDGYEIADNLSIKAEEAFSKGDYYSSASFCFGANIRFSEVVMQQKNESRQKLGEKVELYFDKIGEFEKRIEAQKLDTMTDLQAYIIVRERLDEAYEYLIAASNAIDEEKDNSEVIYSLAYGIERYNSAVSWSMFLGKPAKAFEISEETIRDSCIQKISEAEERINYLTVYFNLPIANAQDLLMDAKIELEGQNYRFCLFRASKSKAEADIILSLMGVEEDKLENYVDTKLDLVRDLIARQQDKGVFPILGYSYYQYATTLKEEDVYSAIVYSEYALELSNLDLYFKETKSRPFNFRIDMSLVLTFVMGIVFGLLISYLVRERKRDFLPNGWGQPKKGGGKRVAKKKKKR